MKGGFLQYAPEYLDVDRNLVHVEALLRQQQADLIVLPELFASGYFFRTKEDVVQVAEPIPDGKTTQTLLRWARELQTTLVAGLPERDGGRVFNSAVVVAPSGVVGTYRKVHLYYEEKTWFAPGDSGFQVFDVRDRSGTAYRLGVMICFDWYFPEAARSLTLLGADVIAHPSNLVRPDCPRAMPIRALENHVYTITANRYGEETAHGETLRFIGQSEICDPGGHVLASAGEAVDTVTCVDIDPRSARERQITSHNHLLGDRQHDLYVTKRSVTAN